MKKNECLQQKEIEPTKKKKHNKKPNKQKEKKEKKKRKRKTSRTKIKVSKKVHRLGSIKNKDETRKVSVNLKINLYEVANLNNHEKS